MEKVIRWKKKGFIRYSTLILKILYIFDFLEEVKAQEYYYL
jgi:hypothetical protein